MTKKETINTIAEMLTHYTTDRMDIQSTSEGKGALRGEYKRIRPLVSKFIETL